MQEVDRASYEDWCWIAVAYETRPPGLYHLPAWAAWECFADAIAKGRGVHVRQPATGLVGGWHPKYGYMV